MSLDHIHIVLVRPLYGGNIGSICRAIKNMGLSSLRLVAPQSTVDFEEAKKLAVKADDILSHRKVFHDLPSAVADCVQVAGTTNRCGPYRSHSKTPREWAPHFLQDASQDPVALVFGPEDSGLSNEELALCTQLIRIPSSADYPSLNLAQAVMVCCYELFLASGDFQPVTKSTSPAPSDQRERMHRMWDEMLQEVGFYEDQKAKHMMMSMRRIFSSNDLTVEDVNLLMGICRQTMWRIKADSPQ